MYISHKLHRITSYVMVGCEKGPQVAPPPPPCRSTRVMWGLVEPSIADPSPCVERDSLSWICVDSRVGAELPSARSGLVWPPPRCAGRRCAVGHCRGRRILKRRYLLICIYSRVGAELPPPPCAGRRCAVGRRRGRRILKRRCYEPPPVHDL
jgi:hypothetical protein